MRSPIRWAGSKRQLLQQLRTHWLGTWARYIEPFAGSASLFFDIQPPKAVLGDLNYELVCTLRSVQRDVREVVEHLRALPKGRTAYYRIRTLNPWHLGDAQRAARFLYLNRYCFNGLYRTNKDGDFNVPYGPPKSGRGVDEALVIEASRVLRVAELVHGDFELTIDGATSGDFVYLDPPYAVAGRRIFAEYGPGSFTGADLPRLARALESLESKGAKFVVTYADSPEARNLLAPWRPRRTWTRRNIAGFVSTRRGSYELVATNSFVGGC